METVVDLVVSKYWTPKHTDVTGISVDTLYAFAKPSWIDGLASHAPYVQAKIFENSGKVERHRRIAVKNHCIISHYDLLCAPPVGTKLPSKRTRTSIVRKMTLFIKTAFM